MGDLVDSEQPLKRVKSSRREVRSISKDLSLIELVGSSRDTMAKSSSPSAGDDAVGSGGIIKKVEFVRIITKALYSLGYERSGALLEEESGIPVHSPKVNLFTQQVLNGNWDNSVVTLGEIGQLEEKIVRSVLFLILEQKFLELLGDGNILDALRTLRLEIAPLHINKHRMHELAGCLVSPPHLEPLALRDQYAMNGNPRLRLLEKLQKFLPPSVMVPEKRLEHLLEQALNVQRESCVFHNSLDTALSLYTDHLCGKDQIPTKTLQVGLDPIRFKSKLPDPLQLASQYITNGR